MFSKMRVIIGVIVGIIIMIIGGISSFSLFENVPAGYVCVIQSPVSGELTVYTDPGLKWQGFGKVTLYPRTGIFEFNKVVGVNSVSNSPLKITFNDGGEALISGSIRYDYPLEVDKMKIIHRMFSNHESVVFGLIKPTVERSIYMSGPLMTSIDSFMSRRADLPKVIEDQARNGLYEVQTKDVVVTDELTKDIKKVKQAEPIADTSAPNGFKRQDESVLTKYGMSLSNFTTNTIAYSEKVQERVDALFAAASEIQIATLNAKKAEQDTKTEEEKGKANSAIAEWRAKAQAAEETEQARKVAEIQRIDAERDKTVNLIMANQKREVAEQEKITASLYKDAQLLRAEADSTYRKKIMESDGALTQKLEAFRYAVDRFASAMENYTGNWVPSIVMGGDKSTGNTVNGATTMMEFLTIKAAKDLALDMNMDMSTITGKSTTK